MRRDRVNFLSCDALEAVLMILACVAFVTFVPIVTRMISDSKKQDNDVVYFQSNIDSVGDQLDRRKYNDILHMQQLLDQSAAQVSTTDDLPKPNRRRVNAHDSWKRILKHYHHSNNMGLDSGAQGRLLRKRRSLNSNGNTVNDKPNLPSKTKAAMKNQAINPQNGGRAQAMLKAIFDGIGPVINPPKDFLHDETRKDVMNYMDAPLDTPKLQDGHRPEQIHIALGSKPSEMIVVWATQVYESGSTPVVRYGIGPNNYSLQATGKMDSFYIANAEGTKYHYRVLLENLKPNAKYSYRVEVGGFQGVAYEFDTIKDGVDWSPEFIVYGDMGRTGGAPSLRRLKSEAHSGRYAAFIHSGDFAYNFNDEEGVVGDHFMNRIQDIAARVPYMTCPGNHELYFDFIHYRYRFAMPTIEWPTPVNRMWYSFNVANIHFISYSTEVYFTYNQMYASAQYDWLQQDLAEANKPENRTLRPWIIVFGHRPMYCSNADNDDCTHDDSIVRQGLEELFFSWGVDLIMQAHEHSYERLYPVFNYSVQSCNYTDPQAPIHLVAGAAGCNEQMGLCADVILKARGPWSAFRSWLPGLNGYGRLKVHNDTHLHWEQVLAVNGQVMDSFWLVQHHHAPFPPPNTDVRRKLNCSGNS